MPGNLRRDIKPELHLAGKAGVANGTMPFLEHLDELRKRLIVSVVAVGVGFVVALTVNDHLVAFIMRPLRDALPPGGRLIFTEPTEAFVLYLSIAALGGLILALPVILWQLWQFLAPGLYGHEKALVIPFVALATTFFAGGALFSHFVAFPWAWRFLASYETEYVEFAPRIRPTFSLYVRMLLAFGAVFQMPTLALFLSRIGVLSHGFLLRNARYAVLIVFIVAAVVTPTSDPIGQILMAGPMLALYALSILIAWACGRTVPPELK